MQFSTYLCIFDDSQVLDVSKHSQEFENYNITEKDGSSP